MRGDKASAFTLMELLIVIIVIAVLAAIALPKFVDSGLRSKEASLKANLRVLRQAYERCVQDTGLAPRSIEALTRSSSPAFGYDVSSGFDDATSKPMSATDWHGPYLYSVPQDPITNDDFDYSQPRGGMIHPIHSTGSQRSTEGTRYYTW